VCLTGAPFGLLQQWTTAVSPREDRHRLLVAGGCIEAAAAYSIALFSIFPSERILLRLRLHGLRQNWEAHGFWTNMGHTHSGSVDFCASRCTGSGTPSARVLSIREPFAYWRSLYQYAWMEEGASYVTWYLSQHDEPTKHDRRHGTLRTFESFLHWVEEVQPQGVELSQSSRVHRACGKPCTQVDYDHLIRTERLNDDWLALLLTYNMPLIALPRLNQNSHHEQAPAVEYTPEAIRIIRKVDHSMFSEFGYSTQAPT